jgi:hypothetical protein
MPVQQILSHVRYAGNRCLRETRECADAVPGDILATMSRMKSDGGGAVAGVGLSKLINRAQANKDQADVQSSRRPEKETAFRDKSSEGGNLIIQSTKPINACPRRWSSALAPKRSHT